MTTKAILANACFSIVHLTLIGTFTFSSPAQAESIATNEAGAIRYEMWNAITDVQPGPAQSLGFYTAGCLIGGEAVQDDNIIVMHPERHRFYGHPQTVAYLKQLAQRIKSAHAPYMLLGDVAGPRGGPVLNGHASHNNGLDADIWYLRREALLPEDRRESLEAPLYAIDRKTLAPEWGADQDEMVSAAADNPLVDRIFVAPAIKRYFCNTHPTAPWLYKIRAWWGHDEHFHVRLKCPPNSDAFCQRQPQLDPHQPQCGTNLDWWFSHEADRRWHNISSGPTRKEYPTRMPRICRAMIPYPDIEPLRERDIIRYRPPVSPIPLRVPRNIHLLHPTINTDGLRTDVDGPADTDDVDHPAASAAPAATPTAPPVSGQTPTATAPDHAAVHGD